MLVGKLFLCWFYLAVRQFPLIQVGAIKSH
jgi:hypothetical protein